ncbi:MAG: RIO1 family regulatory kinase/ATPase [Candidatus Nanohaloarchaea archaeon]|nr:RIO1 family regulatory kinase/ATPase [Candidatus Nanohaloarchaea archaeon]
MRLVSGTLYKSSDERTDPVGGAFTLQDEYEALVAMDDAGASVPTPHGYDQERGEYGMEHIDGTDLQELATDGLTAADRQQIADRLEDELDRMHEAGLPHGDICTSNIVIDEELRPYYLDPAGFEPDHPDAEAVMERDRQNLDYVTDVLTR